MDNSLLIQPLIELTQRKAPVRELTSAFEASVQQLGFRYFMCRSHFDANSPVLVHNYPKLWAREFFEQRLDRNDPVSLHAKRTAVPFSWGDAEFLKHLTQAQTKILERASTFGIVRGYTIPLHGPANPSGSCSLVPGEAAIESKSYATAHLLAIYFYAAMCKQSGSEATLLSERQHQCLRLVAKGKTDGEIARILGVSESTIATHVTRAMQHFGVHTREQAVVHAYLSGQIGSAS